MSSTFSLAFGILILVQKELIWLLDRVLDCVTQQYCTLSPCTGSLSLISPCRRETLSVILLSVWAITKREKVCCVFVFLGVLAPCWSTWHYEILSELHYGILWCLNQSFFSLNLLCLLINTKTWHQFWYVSDLLISYCRNCFQIRCPIILNVKFTAWTLTYVYVVMARPWQNFF